MATKTTVTLSDDLDPELPAEETVQFSLDGTVYEIDLTAEHAGQLRDALAVYVGSARKVSRSGARPASRSTRSPGSSSAAAKASKAPKGGDASNARDAGAAVDSKAVREWAKAQGKPVSERGRIASSLLVEFTEAHSA